MAVTQNGPRAFVGRQWELVAMVDYGSDVNDLTQSPVVSIPPGSYLTDGFVNVSTVFGGTTPKLTVLDNSGTPVSLFGNVAADAVAVTGALVAGKGKFYPFGAKFTVLVAGGTVTAGLATVVLKYVTLGRENEVYTQ
jgi:hypothetical protein